MSKRTLSSGFFTDGPDAVYNATRFGIRNYAAFENGMGENSYTESFADGDGLGAGYGTANGNGNFDRDAQNGFIFAVDFTEFFILNFNRGE